MNHEFDAIAKLFQQPTPFQHPTTCIGNGDDASTHRIPDGYELVISTDTAVENIHWPHDMELNIAGARAINAALSDLAAMGAKPAWIWLSVMAKNTQDLQHMSLGIVQACQNHHVELAGGDTVSSPINALNVTVGGLIKNGKAMTRNAANIEDEVWLMGDLGLSAAGLNQWLEGEHEGVFTPHFQKIHPQLEQSQNLIKLGVQCCIDVSDGLLQDAGHIAKASQVGIIFDIENIKQLPAYTKLQHLGDEKALKNILSGGEDYALLCTAPVVLHDDLLSMGAHYIGHCIDGNSVRLHHDGRAIDYNIKGFDHFA